MLYFWNETLLVINGYVSHEFTISVMPFVKCNDLRCLKLYRINDPS